MSGAGVLSEGGGVCLRRREGGEDLVVSCGVCCGGREWVGVGGAREGGRSRGGVWCLVVVAGFGERRLRGCWTRQAPRRQRSLR